MDSTQDGDLALFFGELRQSEHFSEIKQPLNCNNWYLSFPICTIRLKANVFRKPIVVKKNSSFTHNKVKAFDLNSNLRLTKKRENLREVVYSLNIAI